MVCIENFDWVVATQTFFVFTPIPREMIQFDEHIFRMGWNHQLYSCFLRTLMFEKFATFEYWIESTCHVWFSEMAIFIFLATRFLNPFGNLRWQWKTNLFTMCFLLTIIVYWGVVSYLFYVHPYFGKWSKLTFAYFQSGWNTPTSLAVSPWLDLYLNTMPCSSNLTWRYLE